MHSICIVGSGPAGFYTAELLAKEREDLRVDIIDRLPTPYGLVRTGVAPDHQGTKRVWKLFDRTARRAQVRLRGNVEVGRDVSLAELRSHYDAVILAVGAPDDRQLGIAGEQLQGVYGSGAFTSWYNGHPDYADLVPKVAGRAVAVIGNGNVALDVARLFGRTERELAESDMPEYARTFFAECGVTDVYVLGRRGPLQASFGPVELRQLGDLERAVACMDAAQLPEGIDHPDSAHRKILGKNMASLRKYAEHDPRSKPVRIWINFFSSPEAFLGDDQLRAVRVARTRLQDGRARPTGETYELEVGAAVTCIGYRARPIEGLPGETGTHYTNDEGRVAEGLWAVGWAKRGPTGTIGTNRTDSKEVVARVLAELGGEGRDGPAAIDRLLGDRGVQATSFEDWLRIDAHELELAAATPAPRVKLTDYKSLLAAVRAR